MKRPRRPSSKGFTLIEVTLALALTLGVVSTVVAILQQQVSFSRIIGRFQFLREEAPQINTLLSTLVGQSDSYRIYPSRGDAMAGVGAVTTGGRALRLRFRNPDGTAALAVVAFENTGGEDRLNFYYRASDAATWPGSPSWTISSSPAAVDFSNNTGILLVAMTGPSGEEITYAGNPN